MSENFTMARKTESGGVYDLIGLGFGPSNLALAATVEEEAEATFGRRLDCVFFERKPDFAWHPDMLLDGAQIQLSFLKDLVTLRNPQSRFSFLCYLKAKKRLDRFVNLRSFHPTRIEYNDYYSWVAGQLASYVEYGSEVVSVSPAESGGGSDIRLIQVEVRNVATRQSSVYLTRNLVVATGGVPSIPGSIRLKEGGSVFHSQDFAGRIAERFPERGHAYRFAVVGSGQSAAEIFHHLYSTYPQADVTALMRRFAYKPADDSHFVNEIFFPRMEDFLFDLPEEKRRSILAAHRDTNYSCVDLDLIEEIYKDLYASEVVGEDRFRIRPFCELRNISENASGAVLELCNVLDETAEHLEVDGAVLATGFVRPEVPPLLSDLAPYLRFDGKGRSEIERSFRVKSRPELMPRIFLQGFCEDTHGLSDTLLSTLPARSIGILRELWTGPDADGADELDRVSQCEVAAVLDSVA